MDLAFFYRKSTKIYNLYSTLILKNPLSNKFNFATVTKKDSLFSNFILNYQKLKLLK